MTPSDAIINQPEFREAYRKHELQERINTGKIAAALVVFLMPAGVLLDYFVYPAEVGRFLVLRLACSALAGGLWYLHTTKLGQRNYRLLGLPIALLPALFIAWMILVKEGPTSPYYAGLNLILLAVSVVVRWSLVESVLAVVSVILMYAAACLFKGSWGVRGIIFNNAYFLVLTGIIVVIGNSFFNRLRFREFTLSFELDRNRKKLEESNQKLTELDQVKSRFFANISHELRTPLTLLLAPLETLLRRFSSAFDQDQRELLATMHSNGMRLLKLINDLLDLVRLESGRIHVKQEPLGLVDFVNGLASAARQMAQDKRIELRTTIAPGLDMVVGDRDKIEKILLNLLFNALKFTPAGGRVELKVTRQGDQLLLVVQDTGMGISAKNLPHVFDRFWQADDSSRRKYQGVGIGLALVKEFAEVQGGSVAVESTVGSGTTFTVTLPFMEPDPAQIAAAAQEAAAAHAVPAGANGSTVSSEEWLSNLYRRAELFSGVTGPPEAIRQVEVHHNSNAPKILVADDEPDMLRFLKSQLVSHYQVLEAVDGQQAVEKATQFLPDIILLDMMMPEKDGLQACRELRERDSTRTIPIILLTARADEETKMAALSAGASDFLPKPFSTTELHVRIKNLVESHHYQRKLSKQNQTLSATIEQLKETEMQLVQTEKLASLGRMSAGIIHEINNPLNFATTGLFTLRNKGKYLSEDQRADYAEVLKDVEEGISRVKNIVSDLRSFSHPDAEQLDHVEVTEMVTSALRFLSNEWKDRVVLEQKLDPDQTVWANRSKLIQVVTNLLQNSMDALKEKTFPEGEKPTIRIEGRVQGTKSIIVVWDNGPGIDAAHVDKIFDPFFTTKDVGAGMGLGLSICYRIVQQYDGVIAVKTEPGKYTEFSLEFPVKG